MWKNVKVTTVATYNSFRKEECNMKFHLFSLIITIQKKSLSEAELKQEQQYKKIMDEIRDRRTKYYSHL